MSFAGVLHFRLVTSLLTTPWLTKHKLMATHFSKQSSVEVALIPRTALLGVCSPSKVQASPWFNLINKSSNNDSQLKSDASFVAQRSHHFHHMNTHFCNTTNCFTTDTMNHLLSYPASQATFMQLHCNKSLGPAVYMAIISIIIYYLDACQPIL